MNYENLLFIYNPKAGRGQIKNNLAAIVQTAVEYDYAMTVIPTKAKGDAIEIIKSVNLNDYARIICSGGDGTLAEVINGLMAIGAKIPIGYIPFGSTNDFASTLQLPKDIEDVAKIAIKGDLYPCDIGSFNNDFFVYIAAFGLFTDVSYSTDQNLKNVLGHLAYVLKGATELSNIKSYHMRIEYDDGVIDDNFILGMISSTTSVGGILNLSFLDVSLNDGYYEVVLFKTPNASKDIQAYSEALSTGSEFITPHIVKFKASYLNITSYDNAPWTIDGEFGGDDTHITIKNLKQAVNIACPLKSEI